MDEQAGPSDIDLGGRWMFAVTDRAVDIGADASSALSAAGTTLRPAEVPGNVELDLQRSGLIGDPFFAMGVVELRWLEESFCYYLRRFVAPSRGDRSPILVFEGLDCDARILLNGELVAQTRNMLIEHRVPIDQALRDDAENELVVEFSPVLQRARRMVGRYTPGLRAEGGSYGSLYVRKAPHMFGWDIMPRALSAGIWRAVTLRYLRPQRIESLWLDTEGIEAGGASAMLALHYQVLLEPDPFDLAELRISGHSGAARFTHTTTLLFAAGLTRFSVTEPLLWWPRGRGDPALYDVAVELWRDGRVLDARSFRHGIRTVALDRTSVVDAAGEGEFRIAVNGEPLFVLGTNWVPLDAYHSRDLGRLPTALAMVEELGCNLIRCWGGNVYEHDRFFDRCDDTGILVWQDFAMACAVYPQDEEFQADLREEVQQVVRRLRQHACVLLWAGDNECDEQYVWKDRRRDPNQNVLTRWVIPEVLRAEDPSRPYLPSSPYVDAVAFASAGRSLPEDHLWGPRDYYKGPFYTGAVAHFASEIGYPGAPAVDSMRRFLSPERLWPYTDNPEWLLHATSPFPGIDTHDYRLELLAKQIRVLFGEVPATIEDFVLASQASQAEALKFFIESFRSRKWHRTGIIWWNLLDGWPQLSDALVDYYLVRKRAFDYVKRAQAPICVVLCEPADGRQRLVVCNDTRRDVTVNYSIHDVVTQQVLASGSVLATRDAVADCGSIDSTGAQGLYLITWDSDIGTGRSHYLAGSPPYALEDYESWMAMAGF